MKANKVFISAPISMDWSTILKFSEQLKNNAYKTFFWDRESKYDDGVFESCDTVLFLLPNNEFSCDSSELPIGLRVELSRAYATSKSIFIGYVTSIGSYNIYKAQTDGRFIKGIAGTSGDIYLKRNAPAPKKKVADVDDSDLEDFSHYVLKAKRAYATTIPNPDYVDERLVLAL